MRSTFNVRPKQDFKKSLLYNRTICLCTQTTTTPKTKKSFHSRCLQSGTKVDLDHCSPRHSRRSDSLFGLLCRCLNAYNESIDNSFSSVVTKMSNWKCQEPNIIYVDWNKDYTLQSDTYRLIFKSWPLKHKSLEFLQYCTSDL